MRRVLHCRNWGRPVRSPFSFQEPFEKVIFRNKGSLDSRLRGNDGGRRALSFLRRQESRNMEIRNETAPKSLFQRALQNAKCEVQNYSPLYITRFLLDASYLDSRFRGNDNIGYHTCEGRYSVMNITDMTGAACHARKTNVQ